MSEKKPKDETDAKPAGGQTSETQEGGTAPEPPPTDPGDGTIHPDRTTPPPPPPSSGGE